MVQNLIQVSGKKHDPEVVAYGMEAIFSGLAACLFLLVAGRHIICRKHWFIFSAISCLSVLWEDTMHIRG